MMARRARRAAILISVFVTIGTATGAASPLPMLGALPAAIGTSA